MGVIDISGCQVKMHASMRHLQKRPPKIRSPPQFAEVRECDTAEWHAAGLDGVVQYLEAGAPEEQSVLALAKCRCKHCTEGDEQWLRKLRAFF